MTDFWLFFKLGFNHVVGFSAYEHLLFIIILVTAYATKKWKKTIGLISIFTIGHSVSLILGAYKVLSVDLQLINFLIPASLIFMALYNIFIAGKSKSSSRPIVLYLFILSFGLVHGFSFASYFSEISKGSSSLLINLVEFALGIDISQVLIVIATFLLSVIFQRILRYSQRDWVLIISSVILGLAIPILTKNWIF
ncbi:MAG: HupE/UreJ family protein [Psychroflexus sp.]|uniref:HupE/UreJ family protein n=1 Tax=Psychroflexus sp. S27 TaxID=1982757 RepID=UPI000C2A48F2|nr:HupE/UreJ family protein [Psychroflexus sp. S27]PJX21555.1 HupE / UreJ protein [Psychroflexus sp. S27]